MLGGTAVEAAPAVSAHAALVMGEEGEVLYSKNAETAMSIASTTKIMTAIIVIENCDLDDEVEISRESCSVEGSSMYLAPGDTYTVRQLLEGLMLASGNDAAHALALYTAGSIDAFARLMNEKCMQLGMADSQFKNPHGLEQQGHYSTAADMARLMLYCMDNPVFAEIVSLKNSYISNHSFVNHNKLLSICPGCIGGKTGYTSAAGRCLVSVCSRQDTQLICVTLSAPDDWDDHMALYDWAYSQFGKRLISEKLSFEIPVISGTEESVVLAADEDYCILPKKLEIEVKAEMPGFVFAPIAKGEVGGNYRAYCDGECVAEGVLRYQTEVESS